MRVMRLSRDRLLSLQQTARIALTQGAEERQGVIQSLLTEIYGPLPRKEPLPVLGGPARKPEELALGEAYRWERPSQKRRPPL